MPRLIQIICILSLLVGSLVVSSCRDGASARATLGDQDGGTLDGGSTGGNGVGTDIFGLQSITVTPQNLVLEVDGTPIEQRYTATGHFADGHVEDISDRAYFILPTGTLGYFDGPTLKGNPDRGGQTTVTAVAGVVSGVTGVTFKFARAVSVPGGAPIPGEPGGRFERPSSVARKPNLVYPNDGVLLPPNLGKLEFHFTRGETTPSSLFELRFFNTSTDVKFYLRCTALETGCVFLPDPTQWRWLAETNRGGDPLEVTLRGTDDDGAEMGVSDPIKIAFSYDDINGGFYYWNTTGRAIMRWDFGSTTQTEADKFWVAENVPASGTSCVGCHALSRDGRKMVMEVQGQNDGRMMVLDVGKAAELWTAGADDRTAALKGGFPAGGSSRSVFESWNPDGSRFVGVDGDQANAGSIAKTYNLRVFDGETAAWIEDIAGTGSQANPANHPDWSPDGTKIAFTQNGVTGTTLQRPKEGSIWMVSRSGSTWGPAVNLVPRVSLKNFYYPAIAPDSLFLVHNQSVCAGSSLDGSCDADADPSATLHARRLVWDNTIASIPLTKANGPGKMDGSNTHLGNSFPKWSPFVFQRTGELGSQLMWVTFSSTRKYGLRSPPGTGTLLWMAAIDPDRLGLNPAEDPSFPAFALPFQDLHTSNHIAQWTTKIVTSPGEID